VNTTVYSLQDFAKIKLLFSFFFTLQIKFLSTPFLHDAM